MRLQIIVALCALAALGATIPCHQIASLNGIVLDEFRVGSYHQIQSGFGHRGVVTIKTLSGECFDIREVDQTIHNDVLGDRAFTVDEPMLIEFGGEDNWGIVTYVGSDTFDQERHTQISCFAHLDDGTDQYIGGDIGQTTFGPEELIEELGDPSTDRGFQYLVVGVYRTAFLNYVPRPIDYCIIDPDGEDVFVGLVQSDVDEETIIAERKTRTKLNSRAVPFRP